MSLGWATVHPTKPRLVRFVEQFPMTATGKIQKFRMRQIEVKERRFEHLANRETA